MITFHDQPATDTSPRPTGRHTRPSAFDYWPGGALGAMALLLAILVMVLAYIALQTGGTTTRTVADGDVVGTSGLGCTVFAHPYPNNPRFSSADFGCTKEALVERVCGVDLSTMERSFTPDGNTLWVSTSRHTSGVVYFYWNQQYIQCQSGGYVHEFQWYDREFQTLREAGPIPAGLASRIDAT